MSIIRNRRNELALASTLLAMGIMPAAAKQANCPPGSPWRRHHGAQRLAGDPSVAGTCCAAEGRGAPNILLIMTDDSGSAWPARSEA